MAKKQQGKQCREAQNSRVWPRITSHQSIEHQIHRELQSKAIETKWLPNGKQCLYEDKAKRKQEDAQEQTKHNKKGKNKQ